MEYEVEVKKGVREISRITAEMRRILHVDMDAFYASVEIRDNPALSGKALIIGSKPTERGVVCTCNYEARKYGVHSAMNSKEAFRLCPNGIFLYPDFEKYKAVSAEFHAILERYTKVVEYIALDEGYLDLTDTTRDFSEAERIGREIQRRVSEELGLSCSVGIAYGKTAAKTASEEKKPGGLFLIRSKEEFEALLKDRDVRSLFTVGKKTAEKLYSLGIHTVREMQEREKEVLRFLGHQGEMLIRLSHGVDERQVVPYRPEDSQSISREMTFQEDTEDFAFLDDALFLLSFRVENRAKRHGLYGRGVSLKLTYQGMKTITRSSLMQESTQSAFTLYKKASEMLRKVPKGSVRLIGEGFYHLEEEEGRQLSFLDIFTAEKTREEKEMEERWKALEKKYGSLCKEQRSAVLSGERIYDLLEEMRAYRG